MEWWSDGVVGVMGVMCKFDYEDDDEEDYD
jgi:hypothetical protein